jgi:lipoprotein-anchoring transpeptidase ErfK/SrfK
VNHHDDGDFIGLSSVRRRAKYRLPASQASRSNFTYLLAALALAVFIGWLWWNSARARKAGNAKSDTTTQPALNKPSATNALRQPAAPPLSTKPVADLASPWPRPVRDAIEAQVALLQHGISAGSLDGAIGPQTRAALAAFQAAANLPVTGDLDAATKSRLLLAAPPYTTYVVTTNDLARLQPISPSWLGKSQQTALDFETILELVAEKTFANPNLIRRLNPAVNWTNVPPGATLQVPAAAYPSPPARAAFVKIHLGGKTLEAFDAATNLLLHFPCSIARLVEKRPVGELHVANIAPNPNYSFDPAVFPESPEAHQLTHKLILPPGPNNPVGVAWIGLDVPGYGIHGTPNPEQVGRTESHGCFRLANWNAEYLLRLVTVGTPVYVVE